MLDLTHRKTTVSNNLINLKQNKGFDSSQKTEASTDEHLKGLSIWKSAGHGKNIARRDKIRFINTCGNIRYNPRQVQSQTRDTNWVSAKRGTLL